MSSPSKKSATIKPLIVEDSHIVAARERKRDCCMRFFVFHWSAFKRLNVVLSLALFMALIGAFVSPYLTGSRFWHVEKRTLHWIAGAWFAIESVVIIFSVYIARKFVFISDQDATGKTKLVMVRRPQESVSDTTVSSVFCGIRPVQVLRWDFAGVFFSNVFGKVNSITLPRFIRAPLFRVWAMIFGANLDECRDPLDSYESLQKFFSRALKPGVRVIDTSVSLTSPVDGRMVLCGEVLTDNVEQVKGVTYSVSQFLGEDYAKIIKRLGTPTTKSFPHIAVTATSVVSAVNSTVDKTVATPRAHTTSAVSQNDDDATLTSSIDDDETNSMEVTVTEEEEGSLDQQAQMAAAATPTPSGAVRSNGATKLFHMVIYLAPGDYHRIHSPAHFSIQNLRHFPGTLFPISPLVARLIPNLFALNERVVLTGQWPHGFFSMTAVGAYNVGSMTFDFDRVIRTNRLRRDFTNPNLRLFSTGGFGCYAYNHFYENGISLIKGQELGRFNLGSTVVMIFEAPADFKFTATPGDKLRLGQPIGTCSSDVTATNALSATLAAVEEMPVKLPVTPRAKKAVTTPRVSAKKSSAAKVKPDVAETATATPRRRRVAAQ